ncbi:MAG: hypothetical protein HQL60_09480, partial [Magnetococcales bacterium]|nr:hypothetical protein [Magnetococcales bacterium]
VMDEYGEIVGVVTMDDIMASIFGEIEKPASANDQDMTMTTENSWKVLGSTSISAFNARMQANLDDSFVQTIAGLVLHNLGEMPVIGSQTVLNEWSFTVTEMKDRRITELLVVGSAPVIAPQSSPDQPSADSNDDLDSLSKESE